ncbi:DUF4404 family protein [Granulosicoccus antarcticus]|uniref:DUF4404 family protein n=1 Tax=Granulosicoccus antarcticus IMCC3135 TaxID=1192854 RepID=A0A2Z2P168_9GAMM|nr:DUF4404 family protein [Granulosicoccus antarcticus]ASJ74127.1 hypothetical protein IMCC3135_20245 [Granulosicoccus antarcticus IMCC3135]
MTNKLELGKAIQELRSEIETLEDSDVETRNNLAQLADLMDAQLIGEPLSEDPSTAESVMALVETYEAKYPRVTAMANDLMTRLAAMGI